MKILLRRIMAIVALTLLSVAAFAQKATISGYVTDLQSGETLIGAGFIEGSYGAVTNSYGFYSITVPTGKHTFTCSYLGFADQEIRLDLQRDTTINISLKPNASLQGATVVASKDAGIKSTKMSAIELPVQVIKHTPVLFGEHDVLKAIQLMPGVQSGNEGTSGIYVRGGGPEENLLLLDGISLYNAEHLLGLMSIFQPEAVKKVTLYKGSFPARYGGRISSIIDVRTNDGNLKDFSGSVGVGALTDKVHLEGPIIKDKLAFSMSGRVLHTFLFTPIINHFQKNPANYYFYDLNGKLSWRISDRDRIFANFYNGHDTFYFNNKDEDVSGLGVSKSTSNLNLGWGNILGGIRWNHVYGSKLFSNLTLAYTRYKMAITMNVKEESKQKMGDDNYYITKGAFKFGYNSGMRDLTAKMDFDYTPVPEHLVKFGGEYVYHTFIPETVNGLVITTETKDGQIGDPITKNFSGSANPVLGGHEASIYAEDDISLGKLVLNPGIHAAFFYTQGTPYWSVEPRMSAKFCVTEDVSFKAAYSRMAQYVHLLSPSSMTLPSDLWVPITDKIRPVTSDQVSIGGYYSGLKGWEFSLEAYYKWMNNILEYRDGASMFGNSSNWQNNVEVGEGIARGVELFVEKTHGATTGWLGYTLAWSDRRFPDGSINGGNWFPYRYDRRHNLSLVANHDFGNGLILSGTWTYATGGTMTVPERQVAVVTPDGRVLRETYISGRNNYRLPSSYRLNLGLSWTRPKKHGSVVWDFSIYNVLNTMNPNYVLAETYDKYDSDGKYVESGVTLTKITMLPIMPSISYTRNF